MVNRRGGTNGKSVVSAMKTLAKAKAYGLYVTLFSGAVVGMAALQSYLLEGYVFVQ